MNLEDQFLVDRLIGRKRGDPLVRAHCRSGLLLRAGFQLFGRFLHRRVEFLLSELSAFYPRCPCYLALELNRLKLLGPTALIRGENESEEVGPWGAGTSIG
jgi:hypothetical protein